MSHIDEEYPGLARYQKALAELQIANSRCTAAATLYTRGALGIEGLQYEVAHAEKAEKELNDAEFCYRHPERAHERS